MNAIDDDDDFLYGGGAPEPASSEVHQPAPDSGNEEQDKDTKDPAEEEDDGEEDMDEEESGDESDIEIITDGPIVPTTKNSLDFRPRQPPTNRSTQQPSGELMTSQFSFVTIDI
ncbi:hypothetical protein FRC15_004958 [Serendipita sp. 397]|nr:hypothetical protein FRC15_004958 [Serendipita sp. 397]